MRWLKRSLLFWAISTPLFYLFGFPMLMEMLNQKAQTEGYTQCKTQMTSEGMIGSANSPVTPVLGEKYCHCVSDSLILTKNDVFDLVQHKPATALNALAQELANKCNRELQEGMGFLAPAQAAPAQPEDSHMQPLGTLP